MPGYCTIRGDVLDYDPRVEALSSDAYRLFMLTLYSQQRTMLGVMRWVPADVVPRVRAWDESAAWAALEELQGVGLVAYDQEARLLFNPLALEFSPIRSVNQVKGAWGALQYLPDSPVLLPAARQILEAAEALDPSAARDLPEITARLRARLSTLERLAGARQSPGIPMPTPCPPPADPMAMASDTPGIPIATPCHTHGDGVAMGSQGVSDGVSMGIQAGGDDGATYCGQSADQPQVHTHGIPMAMGSSRVGAHARPDSDSLPIPKPEEPPQTPPPETARATAGAAEAKGKGDAEGASRYEHLDPRNRGSGPDGAAAGKAGTGNLPGLRPGG